HCVMEFRRVLFRSVLTPVAIGRELSRMAKILHPSTVPSSSDASFDSDGVDEGDVPDDAFRRVLALLKNRFHIHLGEYKRTTTRPRIERRMARRRFEQMAAYVDHLRSDAEALKELHDDLFI